MPQVLFFAGRLQSDTEIGNKAPVFPPARCFVGPWEHNESQPPRSSSPLDEMAILETARLTLRPFRAEDLDPMSELTANTDFMRFSLGSYSREQTRAFLDKIMNWDRAGRPSQFAVIHRDDARLLGYCGFFHHPDEKIYDVEIGYRLHPGYWNRGIATEAARAVRDHGFADWKLERLISIIHHDNIPSRRVAEKNGMVFEREIIFRGKPANVFAISREVWSSHCGA